MHIVYQKQGKKTKFKSVLKSDMDRSARTMAK